MRILLTLIAFFAFTSPLYANHYGCIDAVIMRGYINTTFNEFLVDSFILPNTNILEVYARADYRAWSIVVVTPSKNMACMINYGEGRKSLDAALDEYLGTPA
jgi:hypothetical protein